MMTFWS